MSAPAIVGLGQAASHLAAMAAAHVAAFGRHFPDWTLADATAELQGQLDGQGIPCTWVAVAGGDWLGSVSLLPHDHPQIPGQGPWLASLYVQPGARGRGVGQALVRHATAAARELGVPCLQLYCEAPLVAFYEALGWSVQAGFILPGPITVTVMAIVPADGAG